MQVLAEEQRVVRPGQVSDELGQRFERELAETAVEPARRVAASVALARRDDVTMHGAQMF